MDTFCLPVRAGLPVRLLAHLLVHDVDTSAAVQGWERAALGLREKAVRSPEIMQHSRDLPSYCMLQRVLKGDPAVQAAFPRRLPPISELGHRAWHLQRLTDVEQQLRLRPSPEVMDFIVSGVAAKVAIHVAEAVYRVALPASLAEDVASIVWRSIPRSEQRSQVCGCVREACSGEKGMQFGFP